MNVYKGGDWFKECLDSLLPHTRCFGNIVVSFNNSPLQEKDMETFARFREKLPPSITCTCMKQRFSLSASWHGRIVRRWWQGKKFDDIWMCLAHDDILLSNFSEVYEKYAPLIDDTTIFNPARSYYHMSFTPENKRFDYYGFKSFPDGMPVDDFIQQDLACSYNTNMSGLCYSPETAQSISHVLDWLWYGYRGEYFLLTSPKIQKILSTPEPVIGIRMSPDQQGAINHPVIREWDECIYRLHLLRRTTDPLLRKKIFYSYILVRAARHPGKYALKLLQKLRARFFK